jgi:CDP-4-dehydro-6-deoxyglucose reductase
MSDLHAIGPDETERARLEAVAPGFVARGLQRARERSWKALAELRGLLREGMTEDEARRAGMKYFADLGVTKHWHKVYLRFGPGTQLTFNEPLQADYRLKAGDPYYIDLGPVWPASKDEELGLEYEGDVGDSFVFGPEGSNPEAEKCALEARKIFEECRAVAAAEKLTGEGIYAWLRARADRAGYDLIDTAGGHRVSDFPHHKYSKQSLAKTPFNPSASLWVLEVMLRHRTLPLGAFFEDLL